MTPPDAPPLDRLGRAESARLEHSPSEPIRPGRGPLATVRKYAKILRASLIERMAYRGDFLFGTLLRFLPMLTTILLWKAIYAGSGQTSMAGFNFNEMICYLLMVNISRMFSSMPNLAGGIARDIREGTLKRYLIQPVDMIGYLVSYRVAHKAAYIVTSAIPYGILFFVCRGYFSGFPDPLTLLAFAASLILAFVVGFFFETCVGMVGFWFLEVTSLLYIVMTMNFFISGQMLPLDLLPQPWSGILKALPFQYMAYFPAVVFLGKVKGPDLVWGLLGELAWAVFFIVLARGLFRLGLRRYSAFGADRTMHGVTRYFRLLGSLAQYTLAREMAFRGNFLVKISVEVIWLGIMLAFYETIFARTKMVAGWPKFEYLFFVGCFFALNGLIETLFLENCNEFGELVRTGDLDFLLLRPIDEQFLISCRRVDWGTAPNILMGFAVMGIALFQMNWHFDLLRVLAFLVTFGCGTAIAYGFMLMLTAMSVWMVRNQSLMEMWWLFSSLARYPKEIFLGTRAEPIGFLFTFILPILLVANVPANAMVRALDPGMIGFTIAATGAVLVASRWFFRHALRSYRSASS